MWYFAENNSQRGPVSPQEIANLIQQGLITPSTLVWRPGMANWQAISQTELNSLLPSVPPVTVDYAGNSYPNYQPVPQQFTPHLTRNLPLEITQLETWFKVYWICLAAGIPLSIILIGIFGVIAAIVFAFLILYKSWKIIQDGRARTTPEKAVGFLFIPFFNFYWQFVAYWGLAQDQETYIRQRGIQVNPLNPQLVLINCILNCCAIIPYLGILALIASFVLWIIIIKGFKDNSIAILKHQIRSEYSQ